MTVQLLPGPRTWRLQRDRNGYRTYRVVHLVRADDQVDGPANVLQVAGLPIPGQQWQFYNDLDVWVWCRPDADVSIHEEKEGEGIIYRVEQTFSNEPTTLEGQRCQDVQIENPLLEPQKISGSFVKSTTEYSFDRYGDLLVNSAWEMLHGPQVEFDNNRPQVRIEQNVSQLGLGLFAAMIDTVNSSTMWGLPPRCIKLSNVSWEKKLWGTCFVYYTRVLEFDINYNTFDRYVADEGTKVLFGKWDDTTDAWVLININGTAPDPSNPKHFKRFTDREGNTARVILNGAGLPADVTVGTGSGTTNSGGPGSIYIEAYDEANFFLLGVPATLD